MSAEKNLSRTFDADQPAHVEIDVNEGRVALATTTDGVVDVRVDGPRADEFLIDQQGRQVLVRGPKERPWFGSGSRRHDIRIALPESSDVTARIGSADLSARGRYGDVSVKNGSGDVNVEEAAGLSVLAGSGNVCAGRVRRDTRIKTGSGDITIGAVGDDGSVATGSGDVRIAQVHARLTVKTGSGDTRVQSLGGDLTVATASGDVAIDRASEGRLSARTASGDVRVGVAAGTPVWTQIHTATGRVSSQLPPVGAPEDGQVSVQVVIQSATGDVVLVPVGPAARGTGPQSGYPQDARVPNGPQDAPLPSGT